MRVAFYAPMKPPDHPVPSGDRRMAQLLLAALGFAGYETYIDLGRDDRPGIQVDRVLRLVGETGAPVLELGDPGLGVGRRGPLGVRQPLAPPLPVEPDQVLGRRRRDPALL